MRERGSTYYEGEREGVRTMRERGSTYYEGEREYVL